jgi:hypothetical protein
MNTTFLASSTNYSVATADKSDLDMDCHNFYDENKNLLASDTLSVGTRSSYHSNLSHDSSVHHIHGTSVSTLVVVDSNKNDIDDDEDDDDDMDSFCDAEGAEPADEEYMRKDLGASCIWSECDETMILSNGANTIVASAAPAPRRGGKKQSRTLEMKNITGAGPGTLSNSSNNTNGSNGSNPVHERTTHTVNTKFTVMNTYHATM